jgi:hypothetical protein
MDRETLRAADEALLVCGARASALRHPNREHPPRPIERGQSMEVLRRDLRKLAASIGVWLRSDEYGNGLHESGDGGGG